MVVMCRGIEAYEKSTAIQVAGLSFGNITNDQFA
jgi:hypothetical protein